MLGGIKLTLYNLTQSFEGRDILGGRSRDQKNFGINLSKILNMNHTVID